MLSAKFNKKNYEDIIKKLNKLKFVTSELSNPKNPINEYRYSLLLQYQGAVVRVMGAVEADVDAADIGNAKQFNVNIELQGIGSKGVSWRNLSAYTIDLKKELKWSLKLWEATGMSKRAVRLDKRTGFVGIDEPEALAHALRAEYGVVQNNVPSRALFTIANSIMLENLPKIRDRIREIILTYVSWGS